MREEEKNIMLKCEGLGKKFCRDLHQSMLYGAKDMLTPNFLQTKSRSILRAGEFWAVEDADIELYKGDILGIIGVNGSGKTTLMRMLSGIYPPDKGRILLFGDYRISPIFALASGMNPHFSGRENVYMKGAMYGMSRAEISRKMDFIIDFSELEAFMDSPLGNYSNGMRARLAYATALATNPDIFIIDEALAVGDPPFKAKCFANLREIAPQKGIIVVSNNVRKVLKVANRMAILDKARIVFETQQPEEAKEVFLNHYAVKDKSKNQVTSDDLLD
jgi:lipopolysaccharide transport system ATP-binding protein